MNEDLMHSEKRQWKKHEYSERVVKGNGVPGYIYPEGNSNHNTTAKNDSEKSAAEKWLEKSEEIEKAKKAKKKSSKKSSKKSKSSKSKSSKSSKKSKQTSSSSKSSESTTNTSSTKSESSKETDMEKKMNSVLPSGFEIYESYEEDGRTVFLIDAPNGQRHEFIGVPSKNEMDKWAKSLKHFDFGLKYIAMSNKDAYLAHHGILGQKWGIRRYQNKDGSLTPEGRARYGANFEKGVPVQKLKKAIKDYNARTGQNLKLKDARAVRVGQYLYDKKGRRIYEDTKVEPKKETQSTESAPKQKSVKDMTYQELVEANNLARAREEYMRNYGPKPKVQKQSAVGSFFKSQASRALNSLSTTALDAGKRYLQKELEEALGLREPNPNESAPNMAALYKKPKSQWTNKDWGMDKAWGQQYKEYLESEKNAKIAKEKAKEYAKQDAENKAAREAAAKLEEDYLRSWLKERESQKTDDRSYSQKKFDEIVEDMDMDKAYSILGGSYHPPAQTKSVISSYSSQNVSSMVNNSNKSDGKSFINDYNDTRIWLPGQNENPNATLWVPNKYRK